VDSHFAGFQKSGGPIYQTPNRSYLDTVGRWMTPDPGNAGADVGDSQSWDMYSYVGDNPSSRNDPSGLLYCGKPDESGTSNCVLDEAYFENQDQYKGYTYFESNYPQEHPDEARVQTLANDINSLHPNDFILAGMGTAVAGGVGVGGALTYGGAAIVASAPRVATILGLTTEATLNPEVQKIVSGVAPDVSSPALQKYVGLLYQVTDQLPGGTAGAVRWEQATGELLSQSGHGPKAEGIINGLNRLLATGTLSAHDAEVARALIQDLKDALGGN
jgi:RHS repeat-associated protein